VVLYDYLLFLVGEGFHTYFVHMRWFCTHSFLLRAMIGNSQVDFTSMGFTQSSSIGGLNVSVGQINYTNDSNSKAYLRRRL